MVGQKTISVSLLAVFLAGVSWPVQGYFQAYGFFNASNKYSEWFKETSWFKEIKSDVDIRRTRGLAAPDGISVKYPYPDKKLVMTQNLWRESYNAVEDGKSKWFDVEVVRQRAEVEEYPPAMDFLAWMYEEGRGLERDYKKAFMWYERAKLKGKSDLRGSSAKIFDRLDRRQKLLAQVQLAEDIARIKPDAKVDLDDLKSFELVRLHVLKQQRDPKFFRKKRLPGKK
ncbi:MAG: SEL1-like repeat protein [Proteobacteria bacterium]|nr:SEL1-like repeat protein [Pseudomonadota bacterium]